MTTPKPKARKAACVWIIERKWTDTWFPIFGCVYVTRKDAQDGLPGQRDFHSLAKVRIRKYQRIES